jgi:hypothetical protein
LLEASVFSSTLYTSSWFHLHESVLHWLFYKWSMTSEEKRRIEL